MALSPVLPVPVYDFVVDQFGLNKSFFEGRDAKARVWVPESQLMTARINRKESFAVVAPTGGGKTVMGQLVTAQTPIRTLFLVPMRRLAKRHQKLYDAIGIKQQTRVITGESSLKNRVWEDSGDRVIFATGHVVLEELQKYPHLLNSFDQVILDEFHNAATMTHCYSQIAHRAKALDIPRLGLSASPGNSTEQIHQALKNCCLDKIYKVDVPVSKQVASIIFMEEAPCYKEGPHKFIEELIKTEMTRVAYVFNYQAKSRLGVSVQVDPNKHTGYKAIKKLRDGILQFFPDVKEGENHHLFEDKSSAGLLLSTLREYEVWSHIYDLVHNESYSAVESYYQNTITKSDAWYAKRMVKRGRISQIIELTQKAVHPKQQLFGMYMQSMVRRELQVINFASNKATVRDCHKTLTDLQIESAMMLGGNSMKPQEQEEALELIEDKKVQCLNATTVVREGFDLSVDAICNMTPPKSSIDLIQRSGRAGRNEKPAEIVYIANQEERRIIISTDRNVRRLKLSEFSQFGSPISEEIQSHNNLSGLNEQIVDDQEEEAQAHLLTSQVFQPNLF